MGLTRYEQETIFTFNEEEDDVEIYTASPITYRKLTRMGLNPKNITRNNGEEIAWTFIVPKTEFRYRLKAKRLYTDEQRAIVRERFQNAKAKIK